MQIRAARPVAERALRLQQLPQRERASLIQSAELSYES